MRAKILLVEDDASLVELVTYNLEKEGFDVVRTGDGEEALTLAEEEKPDLVILDWMIANLSGIEVCRRLRRAPATANLPIVMLTSRGDEAYRIRGLETGADDYMTKPFSPRELVARVRAILRRVSATPLPPNAHAAAIPLVIDDVRCQAIYFGTSLNLSRYEFRMLKAFAAHPGRVFSREQLMDHASEEPDASMERTVDTHIKTLRARMRGVRAGIDPIVTHRGMGYSLLETWPDA